MYGTIKLTFVLHHFVFYYLLKSGCTLIFRNEWVCSDLQSVYKSRLAHTWLKQHYRTVRVGFWTPTNVTSGVPINRFICTGYTDNLDVQSCLANIKSITIMNHRNTHICRSYKRTAWEFKKMRFCPVLLTLI